MCPLSPLYTYADLKYCNGLRYTVRATVRVHVVTHDQSHLDIQDQLAQQYKKYPEKQKTIMCCANQESTIYAKKKVAKQISKEIIQLK